MQCGFHLRRGLCRTSVPSLLEFPQNTFRAPFCYHFTPACFPLHQHATCMRASTPKFDYESTQQSYVAVVLPLFLDHLLLFFTAVITTNGMCTSTMCAHASMKISWRLGWQVDTDTLQLHANNKEWSVLGILATRPDMLSLSITLTIPDYDCDCSLQSNLSPPKGLGKLGTYMVYHSATRYQVEIHFLASHITSGWVLCIFSRDEFSFSGNKTVKV